MIGSARIPHPAATVREVPVAIPVQGRTVINDPAARRHRLLDGVHLLTESRRRARRVPTSHVRGNHETQESTTPRSGGDRGARDPDRRVLRGSATAAPWGRAPMPLTCSGGDFQTHTFVPIKSGTYSNITVTGEVSPCRVP